MRIFDIKRLRSDQRGEGAMTIVFYIIVVGIIWVVANFVIGYIFTTKEERKDPVRKGKRGKIVTTTYYVKEAGSYVVEFDK